MTLNEFLDHLAKTSRSWRYKYGSIRCENDRCPVVAVSVLLGHEDHSNIHYARAADDMGLDLTIAYDIVQAADSVLADFADLKVRDKLLTACNL